MGPEAAKSTQYQWIPAKLNCKQFEQFVLPHLSAGGRGPAPKLSLPAIFHYILQQLYTGCQWQELPVEKDREGHPEIHYTRVCSAFRRWQADGCFDALFANSVLTLLQADLLDTAVIHGDGTATAAKIRWRIAVSLSSIPDNPAARAWESQRSNRFDCFTAPHKRLS